MEEITEKLREVLGPRSDPDVNATESDEKDATPSPSASSKEATLDAHNESEGDSTQGTSRDEDKAEEVKEKL